MVGVADATWPLGHHAEAIIAAFPATTIWACDQPREAAAAIYEFSFALNAILAIRTVIAFLVGWARKRIDATLVTVAEVARTCALFQSRWTNACSVLTKVVAGAGRIAG
jgi:hypothetical protein